MLIQSRLTKVENSTLQIPIWNRAPVNITEKSNVYASSLNKKKLPFEEIIISPFSPDTWGDIWRVELDVHEKLGLLAKVFELISEEGITILNSETSSFDAGESHCICLILYCKEYQTNLDADFDTRVKKPLFRLQDLYMKLTTHLIEDLIFHDAAIPCLRIKRLSSYYRFFCHLQSGILKKPTKLSVKNGKIKIPTSLIKFPKSNPKDPKCKSLNAMVLTDSKERLIRTIIWKEGNNFFHLLVVCKNNPSVFPRILKFLTNAGFDVVRFHLRQSSNVTVCDQKKSCKAESAKIDLLVRHAHDEGYTPPKQYFSYLMDQVKEIHDITESKFYDSTSQPFLL